VVTGTQISRVKEESKSKNNQHGATSKKSCVFSIKPVRNSESFYILTLSEKLLRLHTSIIGTENIESNVSVANLRNTNCVGHPRLL
jgi:hypothetical protein